MPEVKDGNKYAITFIGDPANVTSHSGVLEMSPSQYRLLDDHYSKCFRPGEKRTEVLVSARQAQSVMDELIYQEIVPMKLPEPKPRTATAEQRRHAGVEQAGLYNLMPPPNIERCSNCGGRFDGVGRACRCRRLYWAIAILVALDVIAVAACCAWS